MKINRAIIFAQITFMLKPAIVINAMKNAKLAPEN